MRFIPLKSDTANVVSNFLIYVKTQFDFTVKRFRSDNGGEYIGHACQKLFDQHGIEWESTTPYGHKNNGMAERFNRTVTTTARSIIEDDNHLFLWAEAIHTATFLRNITSHASLENHITPFEALFQKKPSVKHLRPFGLGAYVHIPAEARKPGTKLLHRAERGIMVGYRKSSKIYRVYIPDRHVILTSQDIKFEPFTQKVKYDSGIDMDIPATIKDHNSGSSTPYPQDIPLEDTLNDERTVPVTPVRKSTSEHHQETTITPLRKTASMDTLSNSPSRIPIRQQTPISTGTREPYVEDFIEPPPTVVRRSTRPAVTRNPTTQPTTTRSGRVTKPIPKASGLAALLYTNTEKDDDDIYAFAVQSTNSVPNTLKQAKASPDWPQWEQAILQELESYRVNNTWIPVKPSPEMNLVGSRWVFAIKHDANGNIAKYKARLVAQGFSQIHGIDFEETYAPVVRYDSLRLLLRFATLRGYHVHQMDFDTAYLNSLLEEDIYMRGPPGYSEEGKVYKILRALYGLKQSGREWFGTLRDKLLTLAFTQMAFDPYVFTMESLDLFVAIYVDDLLIIGGIDRIKWFKAKISKAFPCKDLGQAKYLLGLEITITGSHVSISQAAYARRIIQRFSIDETNPRQTPLDAGIFPSRSQETEDPVRTKEYQRLVGSLNYLVIGTRPDLAFTLSMLGSFNSNPGEQHMKLAKQVLRFIKGTIDYKITFDIGYAKASPDINLIIFANASYASDPNTARSVSGFVLQLAGGTMAWSSKKQSCVAKSTCEAELMACSYSASHLVWTKNALNELGLPCVSKLYTDSQSAIPIIKDHRISARTKHISVHYHYTREHHAKGNFTVSHVASKDNLADVCTKALPLPLLRSLTQSILDTGEANV